MSLRKLNIEESYDSTDNDLVNEFYNPILNESIRYDRIAGFFTSSSLAVSSKGLIHILEKNGKVRFIVSPKLNKEDVEVICNASEEPEKYLGDLINIEIQKEESEIISDYRNLLGCLIARGIVEIRIVLVKRNGKYLTDEEIEKSGMFHQKVGVLYDEEDNILSFSGSINETFNAWNENIEEFKTFKSWEPGQKKYCIKDVNRFESFWNGLKEGIEVLDLPKAVKNKYIEYSNNCDFNNLKKKIIKSEKKKLSKQIEKNLFWYQKEAVEKWEKDKRLLFAMATGTGKTRTALACIAKLLEKEKLLVIISTPQTTLSRQWLEEANKLGIKPDKSLICDSSNLKYKKKLEEYIFSLNLGLYESVILYTTHSTSSKKDFVNKINFLKHNKTKVLFVGDEVHGLGSKEQRLALNEKYEYRIGLSATPGRWFDDEGSKILKRYFGNDLYEFGIEDALREINPMTGLTFLTPYNYYPEFIYLTEDEDLDYSTLTSKICSLHGDEKEIEETRERLLEKRAEIIKNAERKVDGLKKILLKMQSEKRIENTLIFTSPAHIRDAMNILLELNINGAAIVANVDSKAKNGEQLSERQIIIEQFKKRKIQVIVAIKCMDEGIDIPSADTAILMSSTTNPREYIQRIGRVIRRYEGKKYANIYDLVAKSEDPDINYSIQKNELKREKYIVEMSRNSISAIEKIYE